MSKPTPAAGWKPSHEVVELPSGRHARLKKDLSLKALVRRGLVDAEALEAILEGVFSDAKAAVEIEAQIVAAMFIEPKIATDDEDGDVHIDDVSDDDCAFVLDLAFGGTPDLAQFRGDTGGADLGPDGENVGSEAEPTPEHPAPDVPARPKARKSAGGTKRTTASKRIA